MFLKQLPVKMEFYGNISLDGNHIEYTRRMFDPLVENIVKEELEICKQESNLDVSDGQKIITIIFFLLVLGV